MTGGDTAGPRPDVATDPTTSTSAGSAQPGCPLCAAATDGSTLTVAEDQRLRVVRVLDAPDFPAFYRVIWNAHVAELSDLATADRDHCMCAVVAVERVLRHALRPTKINLAALGNMVPHLHWHVIARFGWDAQFPQPIWGPRQRTLEGTAEARLAVSLEAVDAQIRAALLPLLSTPSGTLTPPAP